MIASRKAIHSAKTETEPENPCNLRECFVEVPLQISICLDKEYRESLRHQRIDSEEPPCARAETPSISPEMAAAFLIGAPEK
jgi:hypothetical protein